MTFKLDSGFYRRLQERKEEFLEELGQRIEDYAKDRVWVDTGKLRSEIDHEVEDENGVTTLRVGVDEGAVPYAEHVEEQSNFLYSSFVDGVSEIPEMLE